jgi:hypothetical protein
MRPKAPPFTIDYVAVGLGNKDHHGKLALADAKISLPPFRLSAHLDCTGEMTIDGCLDDPALRAEIAHAVRAAALVQLAEVFRRADALDRRRQADAARYHAMAAEKL